MKRFLSLFLVSLILVNLLSVSSFASEITTAGGNNDVPVELTQSVATFSVTVPTVLPVDLDANGVVTVATDNKIINNSWGPVEVKGVSLTPLNDWVLVDFETDFKNKKVGLKEFGFELNNSPVLTDGSCEATFDVIPGNSEINFTYDANVATQKIDLTDVQIAYVIFTIGWCKGNESIWSVYKAEYQDATTFYNWEKYTVDSKLYYYWDIYEITNVTYTTRETTYTFTGNKIVLPNTIKHIGANAFSCNNEENPIKIVISSLDITIDENAFQGVIHLCIRAQETNLPESWGEFGEAIITIEWNTKE